MLISMLYTKNEDIVKEYSPSKCSSRFQDCEKPNEAVIDHFVRVTTEETNRVRELYQIQKDVRYGGVDDNQLLDIYSKKFEETDTPIFAFIHGGYWQYLNKDNSGSFVSPLVDNGFRVIVADYNLCPSVTLQQLTEQIQNFFIWLFKYASETKAKQFYISGHSAGAHLLSYILSKELIHLPHFNYLRGLFFISGVYDLRELWSLQEVNEKNNLSLDYDEAVELSPLLTEYDINILKALKENGTRFHVLVAENDSDSFKGQTEMFANKLQQAGLHVNHKVFQNYDHFDIIEETCSENSSIGSYILKNISSKSLN